MEKIVVDSNWIDIKRLRISKYNRTLAVIIGDITLLKDLPQDTLVSVSD
jgi:hypothetical protein